MDADRCPTCGQAVEVVTSGEGTSHYRAAVRLQNRVLELRRQLATAYDAIREMAEADTLGEVQAVAANGPLATAPGGPKEDECFRLRELLREARPFVSMADASGHTLVKIDKELFDG